MNRRLAILSIVVLMAGVALLAYFLYQGRKELYTDPYKVIGSDASVVIETIDLRNLINSVTTGKGLFAEIGNLDEFKNFNIKLKYLADQINKPGYKKFLQEGNAIISFHPDNSGKLVAFLSRPVPAETRFSQLKEALLESGINGLFEKKIAGRRIIGFPYTLNEKKDTVFVSLSSGLMICSTSFKMIIDAVFKNSEEDIRNQPGFSRIMLSAGENEDKIFIVFSNLRNTLKRILAPDKSILADRISKLGGSAGGDIFIRDDGVVISGYTESSDPSELLFRHKSVQPVEFRTFNILPSATALFESVVYTHHDQGTMNSSGGHELIINMAEKLKPFIGDEITKAYIDIKDKNFSQNSLIIYELENRVQCENIFLEYLGAKARITYFRPDEQTRIPVWLVDQTGLVSVLVPDFAPGFSDSWYAFYDNYMITGNSYSTVTRLLYDNILNNTLANNTLYRDFESFCPAGPDISFIVFRRTA